MNSSKAIVSVCVLVGLLAGAVSAVNIETVPVGNPGNAGELSGGGAGGYGRDRICGSVGYTYNIGKYEVTAGQYTEFLNKVAGVDTYGLYNESMWSSGFGCKIERHAGNGTSDNPYQYRVAGDYANRPVNFVSWGDAARFANWLHNGQPTGAQDAGTTEDGAYYLNGAVTDTALMAVSREADGRWAITSEDEWYKAAYHKNDGVTGNYFDYPTSSNTAPGYINDSGNFSRTGEGSFTQGGTDPGNYATYDGDGGALGIGSPYYRTEVGEHENSASPYGTFDQGGNVWEWTESVLYSGSSRFLRGGTFHYDIGKYLHASGHSVDPPTYESLGIGFRVVEAPEPADETATGEEPPESASPEAGGQVGLCAQTGLVNWGALISGLLVVRRRFSTRPAPGGRRNRIASGAVRQLRPLPPVRGLCSPDRRRGTCPPP